MTTRQRAIWCAQIPNGRWAVFEVIDDDTHTIIAEFRQEELAREYVTGQANPREMAQLSASTVPTRKPNIDRKGLIETAIEMVAADLPRLFEVHPDGVPATAIHGYGVEYSEALAVMRALDARELGVWRYATGDHKKKVLMPPGSLRHTPAQVSDIDSDAIPEPWRRAVMNALVGRADESGCTSMSGAEIAIAARVPIAVVGPTLKMLEATAEITVARPRSGPRPATYQIARRPGARAA